MARINRRFRSRPKTAATRAQVHELLIGPNGSSAFASPDAALEAWADLEPKLSVDFAAQWYVADIHPKPFAAIAEQYAREVSAGKQPACIQVQQACRRHLNDLKRAEQGGWKYRFDEAKASRVCRFAEMLPHVKGKWAANAERIVLQPWQVFILCSMFGWVKVDNNARRFTLGYIEVGRKNAKSILAAIIGLYMFALDGEFGAEVYSGATKEDQAMEVFRPAMQMMVRSPELRANLGIDPSAKKMTIPDDGSRFEVVVRDPGDGSSPHCGIVDEYHEHDSDALFDTFRTGMGAREQPLELVITTAGFNTGGPCLALRGDVAKVLDGSEQRDEVFGIIYTIDAGDKWTSEEALVKSNPNYGVSVAAEFLRTEQAAAIKSPRKQGVFKIKHLCVWVGANQSFFDLERWKLLGDPSLKPEMFIGSRCIVSNDLSTKRDITARVAVFEKIIAGKAHYYVFPSFYIPEDQVLRPEAQHYQGWVKERKMIQHPGATVDFAIIQAETIDDVRRFRAKEFAFDPWNAAQFAQAVQRETKVPAVEIAQNAKMLSSPMKEADALIAEGRLHHDANPVLTWMIGNVTAHEDANENVFPQKDGSENKIDGAVAMLMDLSRLLAAPPKRSVYATRGILTLDAIPQFAAHA